MEFQKYDKQISDHVGIMIEIDDKDLKAEQPRERTQITDKQWLKKIAVQFLKEFLEADTME